MNRRLMSKRLPTSLQLRPHLQRAEQPRRRSMTPLRVCRDRRRPPRCRWPRRRHGSTSRRRTRSAPLRFMWQMDADGRFSLGSDEFTRLIGSRTAAGFGRLWSDIAETFGLDPEGRVLKAVATHDTWSGITLNWPVDGGGRLPVELSGLPMFDRARNFAGYRGFGVCRDLDGLARLAALRRYELFSDPPAPQALSAAAVSGRCAGQRSAIPADLPTDLPRFAGQAYRRYRRSGRRCRIRAAPELSRRLLPRLHTKPIWKHPWKRPRTSLPFRPGQRAEIAGADAGGKQRLQRTRPPTGGTARTRERRPAAPLPSDLMHPSTPRCRRRRSTGGRGNPRSRPRTTAAGWRAPSRRRAAKAAATRRCSICCRSAC